MKKANEPLHIQWSYADNSVKLINTTLNKLSNVKARAIVYTLDGKEAPQYGKEISLDAGANAATTCFDINFSIDNLAYRAKSCCELILSPEAGEAGAVSDGNSGSRWSSQYSDNEWVYIDLGEKKEIASVTLNWESAYAKAYKIQVSDDAM